MFIGISLENANLSDGLRLECLMYNLSVFAEREDKLDRFTNALHDENDKEGYEAIDS